MAEQPLPLLSEAEFRERYGKRLAIVVPYRDREEHLGPFLTRIVNYFQRDKLDRHIRVSIHVVEQAGDAPFNTGALRNCGFKLARECSDYTCFHDVDYLPIWADYSWTPMPARLIWHGLRMAENYDRFFGAVVLFGNGTFERVNGYPNSYWGWGCEDAELALRCTSLFGDFIRRDGTYLPLQHRHRGFATPGQLTPEARRTHEHYERRKPQLMEWMQKDGIANLEFKLLSREALRLNEVRIPDSFHYLVDIGAPPEEAP